MSTKTVFPDVRPPLNDKNNKKNLFELQVTSRRDCSIPSDIDTHLTASQLFSLFTADIIREKTVFTR